MALKREDYGKFYKGDSYIIISGSEYGKPAGMDDIVSLGESEGLSYVYL